MIGKNVHLWIGSYLKECLRPRERAQGPVDVYFSLMDHFEPYWNADKKKALERVDLWCREYPLMAAKHKDSTGRSPQHSYFYPEEEYDADAVDRVGKLCQEGLGDFEIHLHHDNDTAAGLREKIMRFKKTLHERHGFLKKNPQTGEIEYAFIHGNWALDNSHPDGIDCGINNELDVLKQTGCYADFTMPSAPHITQTSKINSIYFSKDNPSKPKSHDSGKDVEPGYWDETAFLSIQGPLGFNWLSRKFGLVPRIENGEINAENPATRDRVKLWGDIGVHVKGFPQAIFIKTHTHGLQEKNLESFFANRGLDTLYTHLESVYSVANGYRLRYVTAREMFEAVKSIAMGRYGRQA